MLLFIYIIFKITKEAAKIYVEYLAMILFL